jgi:hypothetical protein
MRAFAISLGGALLMLAGCASEEDQLENAIRENLASRGTVKQVELTRSDDNNMTGFAVVQTATGEGRMNCTAQRTSGSEFNWRCVPAIDEAMLTQMENTIRQSLSQQATVLAVDMTRQDDDHMTGHAQVRDADGDEGRVNCTAAREAGGNGNFNWECAPPGSEAEAAEAPAE